MRGNGPDRTVVDKCTIEALTLSNPESVPVCAPADRQWVWPGAAVVQISVLILVAMCLCSCDGGVGELGG